MKKLIYFMLMMVCMTLMSVLSTSCRNHQQTEPDTVIVKDSTKIPAVKLTPVDSLVQNITQERHERDVDQTLNSLNIKLIESIASVVYSNTKPVSKESVYNEYIAHRPFYDNANKLYKPKDKDTIALDEYREFSPSKIAEEDQ